MSFILTPENYQSSNVKISDTLIDDLNFAFMGAAGNLEIIRKYLTTDAEVIAYRQQLFEDIVKDEEIRNFMDSLLEKVEFLVQFKKMEREMRDSGNNERLFSSFRELMFFTECIDFILSGEKKYGKKTKSAGIKILFNKALEISKEEWYQNAKVYIEKTCEDIKEIKSVTIGVNLDAQLGVAEAGLVSINPQRYTTNTILDKMFSKKIADKNYLCIKPICAREMRSAGVSLQIMNTALYNAMSEVTGQTLKKIKQSLYDSLSQNLYFLFAIYDDLKFISMCLYYIISMQASGMPICIPKVSKNYKIEGIYNPNLTGRLKNTNIIKNDVLFDEQGKIFILTGANSGGKTVYLRSVGIAQVLFQLGLPVPAVKAEMQICDEIFSHFASKVIDRSGGRFENECKSILRFYKEITENSLILLDEMFSTTGTSEGTVIAIRILKYFSKIGCKCIYTTHMHDLTTEIEEINSQKDMKSFVDGLSVEMIDGNYTYKIKRHKESYSSYAEEICRKYGFDF